MSGDYSRIAFDPWLDDLGPLLEQGRPLTDRDWNDLVLELTRRIQAGTLDIVGVAVVPLQTPDGFEILVTGGVITIGRGRIYVDGLLAENHGVAPTGGTLDWDPTLAELFGSDPVNYLLQPYYPNPPAVPTGGSHLVYLDVWQREVTRYMRPEMIEPALGLDTSTRLQTVWQVKMLSDDLGSGVDCATPLDQFPGWLPDHAPSGGRLTLTTAPVPGQPDPCQVPPSGGYKGLENQLYRIEIHQGGAPGTATFKWSRDNASVEATVQEIPTLSQLVVDSVGKDNVLRFSDGDWIEITDDWLELHNEPGLMRRITSGGGVDDATRTITIEQPLPAGQFPTDAQNLPVAKRHTRIRRWDQNHAVLDAAGNTIQDLDAGTSDGTITVPTDPTLQVLLEHNIVVSFDLQPAGGLFRSGDYWLSAARTNGASVEELVDSPPRGIHHHYAKLALITLPDTETDCRVFWPPPQQTPPPATGDLCACTACVTPELHANGTLTVQMAIDLVTTRGGGTVCLDVGTYAIKDTLKIDGARSLTIVGKGPASRLLGTTRVLEVDKSQNVTLESFGVTCRPTAQTPDAAVAVSGSRDVTMADLAIRIENNHPSWSGLALAGALIRVTVQDTAFSAAIGIRSGDETGAQTGLTDLRVEDNVFDCEAVAIQLTGVTVHQFVSHIRGNRVTGCEEAGIVLQGATVPLFGVEVASNAMVVGGHGIVSALDGLRVLSNDILQATDSPDKEQDAVRLMPGAANDATVNDIQIIGNRMAGFHGAGIHARVPRGHAWMIKQNHIEHVGEGIVFEEPQQFDRLAIENNQLADITGAGIRAQGAAANLATTGNQIETRSTQPAVLLRFTRGESVFGHNQCTREGGTGTANTPDVVLGGDTLIVASNRIQAGGLSMDLHVKEDRYSALGNICRGRILVNGGALPAPWAPLNLQNVT